MNRTVRRCFLFGDDEVTGRNYDYRKDWIELRMEYLAQYFGIDILCYSILSNHFHQVLRQRPDIVAQWNDTEVAQRWMMLCPKRKNKDGSAKDPTVGQLNELIMSFGNLFSTVAGKPHIVEHYRSSKRKQKFTLKPDARQLLTV